MSDPDFTDWPDNRVEGIALSEDARPFERGAARAEMERRRRDYEERREQDRRRFETDRDKNRIDHETRMAAYQGQLAAVRQDFEERLHRDQMAHQTATAEKQLAAAQATGRTAIWAMLAAWGSAIAAIVAFGWQISRQ